MAQWFALWPLSKKVLGSIPVLCVAFACSPHVCGGLLRALQFPLPSKQECAVSSPVSGLDQHAG